MEARCAEKPLVPEIDLGQGTDTDLAKQICHSLSTLGFACLKSTSLWHQADGYALKARQFFQLPEKDKTHFVRPNDSNQGWVSKGRESINPERPGDYKECFNVYLSKRHVDQPNIPAELHESEAKELIKTFADLSYRVMYLIGLGLNLEDPECLVKCHDFDHPENQSAMRINYYPPLISEENSHIDPSVLKGQVRCGEHSDYGTVTLLYTESPGLEVLNRSTGEYMLCGQKSGGIYLNIGDLLQFWSDDVLIANKHRVMIPHEDEFLKTERMSIAFFCHPNDDTEIRSLTGANKYPPVMAGDWLQSRFEATYHQISQ